MFKIKYIKKSKLFVSMILLVSIIVSGIMPVSALSTIEKEPTLTFDYIINSNASINNNVICFSKNEQQEDDEYVCETIFVIPAEGISADSLLNDMIETAKKTNSNARGSITVDEFDPSISIKGWVQATYSRINSNYGSSKASKVTAVSGGYDKSDRSVSVTKQTIHFGSSGKSNSTGRAISQSDAKYLTNDYSWSYTAPSSWHYIVEAATHNIGANCTFDLKRYGSTWSFTIECIVSEG